MTLTASQERRYTTCPPVSMSKHCSPPPPPSLACSQIEQFKFLETFWSSRILGLCVLVSFPWMSFPMWLVPTQPSIFSSNTINTKFKQNLPQEASSKSPQTVNVSVTFDFYQKPFICSHWNLYCFPERKKCSTNCSFLGSPENSTW